MSDRAYYNLASNGIKAHGRHRKSQSSVDGADRRIAHVHGTCYGPLSTKVQWHVSLSCIVVVHCGGANACTGRGECSRTAPDVQPSANAKEDSITIRAGMALHRVLWRNIITTLDDHDPQQHNGCLSFEVNISVSCLLYCNTIVQEHLQLLGPILLLAQTVDQLDR